MVEFIRLENFEDILKYFGKEDLREIYQLIEKGAPYYRCFKANTYIALDTETKSPLGFINIDTPVCENYSVFLDIYISKEFRGKGLSKVVWRTFERKILPSLLEKLKKKCIHATVEKTNLPSIKFLKSVGFKELPEKFQNILRKRKVLEDSQIRLIKCYG